MNGFQRKREDYTLQKTPTSTMHPHFQDFEKKIRSIVIRCGSNESKMIKMITSMRDPSGDRISVKEAVIYIEAVYKDMNHSDHKKKYPKSSLY
jgi:hypothetical protein